MRKAQKQQVLDFIKSLHQAHEEIKTAVSGKNLTLAQNMLGECQQFAISFGESIEKLEGEGHITVSYVEDYCEVLFCVYEDICNGNVDENKIHKTLGEQLIRIENSVQNDIKVKKEIVFFPYMASMWDSLESVYLAVKEDPECDAFVVPIPYYDLNPDRSFGQMHYEGREYPKNIEVIDWQSYHFEKRKPDEIYIHNPYDSWNLVTSVHPRFYAENLKKYTDKLTYIPYFILNEIEPEDQKTIDTMKQFIHTPGVIYADRIIVQSEKMKEIYVNEYLKFARENGLKGEHLDRAYQQKRIVGLGSPKLDRALKTKKEDLELPEAWMKVIRKPDGNWKKIILYNTGVTALLHYNEDWVEKIEATLSIFKENQNEVALLWRPHPLVENTMRSMRPGILERYLEIKDRYLSEGWGILDATPDLDRALVLSDAYYGDRSSVAELCQKTGKVVMYQRIIKNIYKKKEL